MKKILLVNAVKLQDATGTGHSISAVLESLPAECKRQIRIDFQEPPGQGSLDYFIDREYSPLSWIIANRRKQPGGVSAGSSRENVSGAAEKSLSGAIRDLLRGASDCLPVHITKSMAAYVEDYAPDGIYTCGGSIKVLKTAVRLAKAYNIPIILHIMDDWESTLYKASILSAPFHAVLIHYLKEANRLSRLNFAISQPLCDKLEAEYGSRYLPLMNSVDVAVDRPQVSGSGSPEFLYAGSLSINRWKSLLDVAETLHDRFGEGGSRFTLYVPPAQNTEEMRRQFGQYGAELHDYIPYEEIQKRFEAADVLVIAESFDEEYVEFTKYSLSSKIPEYMAAGKPILAYLSPKCHAYDYLGGSGGAKVAGGREELSAAVDALSDPEERLRTAEAGLAFVRVYHSKEKKDQTLNEVLRELERK